MQYNYGQYPQQQQGREINGIQIDSYNQGTFCNTLPMQNSAIPQVMPTQFLQQGGMQLFHQALGIFRLKLQERAARGALYTFAYNVISQNNFNNEIYSQWGNDIAMFVEFLLVVQGQQNNPQQVPVKVAEIMYRAFYAWIAGNQPGLANESVSQDPQAAQQLNNAANQLNAIRNDLNVYRQRLQQGGQQQYQQQQYQQQQYGGGQQLPPINAGYRQNYGSQPNSHLAQAGVSNMAHLQPTQQQFVTGSTGSAGGSEYGSVEPVETIQPKPQQSTGLQPVESYGLSLPPASIAPVQTQPVVQAAPIQETITDLPIPKYVDEVVMDPYYYVPQGVTIDPARPMDVIYSPGGIESRPAYTVDWELSKSDNRPYGQVMDPLRGLRFYTRFPDGVVQERFVEYTEMMDYQRHEINTALKNAAYKPKGLLVVTGQPISQISTGTAVAAEIVKHPVEDRGESSPVRISPVLCGSSDRENENDAAISLRELLDIPVGEKLPAHEYLTTRVFPIAVADEVYDRLVEVSEFKELSSVGKELTRMLEAGDLPLRDFNLINKRLTDNTNAFLRDRLSCPVKISDFSTDSVQLGDALANNFSEEYRKHLVTATPTIIAQSMSLSRDEFQNAVISDNFINLQVGWQLRELTDAEVGDEAQLVSAVTHQAVFDSIEGMLKRNQGEIRYSHKFRIITLDGHYLEVVRGLLMKSAFLVARLS